MGDILQIQIIYFWEIMLTEENKAWKQYAYYWPIK